MNQSLYNASVNSLTANGVPEELAHKASEIVAKDNASKENSGRSTSDQETINQAMQHFHKGTKS